MLDLHEQVEARTEAPFHECGKGPLRLTPPRSKAGEPGAVRRERSS